MNFATALRNARETADVNRRMLHAGTPISLMMENGARAGGPRIVRPAWTARAAILGSGVDLKYAARFHAKRWRDSTAVLSP